MLSITDDARSPGHLVDRAGTTIVEHHGDDGCRSTTDRQISALLTAALTIFKYY